MSNQKIKQVVHYSDLLEVYIGKRAVVIPVDHPSPLVENGRIAYTTKVMSITTSKSGKIKEFETLNTIYKPF